MKKPIDKDRYIFNKKCLLIILYIFYSQNINYKNILFRSFGFQFDPTCNFKIILNSSEKIHKYVTHIFADLKKVSLEDNDKTGSINVFKCTKILNSEMYIPKHSLNVYFDEVNFLIVGYLEDNFIELSLHKKTDSVFKEELLSFLNNNKAIKNTYVNSFIEYLIKLYSYMLPVDLVLGAGINIEYGAKDWKGLVNSLNNEFYDGEEELIKEIKHYIGKELFVSSKVLKTCGFDAYDSLNAELYLFDEAKSFNDPLSTLSSVVNYIKRHDKTTVITYNYDTNLEYLCKKRGVLYNTVYDESAFLIKEAKVDIFHVHGLLPFEKNKEEKFTSSVIFNEADYFFLYNNPYSWNIAKQLHDFIFNTNILIGISLTDPNMKRLLELGTNNLGFNFIFMKKEKGFNEQTFKDVTNYFFTYDLITIWVDEYREIDKWLELLD